MRNTPVIVFVNKMDREGQNAFYLLDEIDIKHRNYDMNYK